MPASDHKLTTAEMAGFVADGYLRFDALIPDEINQHIIEEFRLLEMNKINLIVGQPADAGGAPLAASLTPLSQCYPAPSLLGAMLNLPEVLGIIESLEELDDVQQVYSGLSISDEALAELAVA